MARKKAATKGKRKTTSRAKKKTAKSSKKKRKAPVKKKAVRRPRQPKIDSIAIGKAIAETITPVLTKTTDILDRAVSVSENMVGLIRAQQEEKVSEDAPKGNGQYFQVGCNQRYTKNMGNYESFVYGFSLVGPVPVEPGDNIESEETRNRLRPKYEATAYFVKDMMAAVGEEIDAARSSV